jgi:copper-binding protein NosD
VILDLNGFKLGGLAAGPGTLAQGIHALNRQNITIKNGTVRGFYQGIVLENAGASQGHVIEDIRADLNTVTGIAVWGTGNIIRNNQVVSTGGTTLSANADAAGIYVEGDGPRVINNDVITTVKQGTGTSRGIYTQSSTGVLAVNNRITAADVGIAYSTSTGKYRDNLTFAVTTPFSGGTDAGNNN